MPELPPVTRQKFIQRLRKLGFEGPFAGGKHPQMKRGDLTLIIPNERDGDIGPGFLHCDQETAFGARLRPSADILPGWLA
jgi:predicted RNA binding protein YcfA (HicA-like mRNA interferase family)